MKSTKKLKSAGVLVGTTLLAASCASGSGSSDEPEADSIDLRMTVWTSADAHLDLFQGIADAYMETHPEISSIKFDPLPFDDYTSTLTTQIAGGSPPDLAWIFDDTAPDFVQSGALVPLNDVLESTDGYEFHDLNEKALELWKDDTEILAYPFSTSPFVTFVNEDLLEESGLPNSEEMVSSGDWTWEKVSAAGSKVKEETGKNGFIIRDFEYLDWVYLSTVCNGWGASPWDEAGTTCTFDSPEMVSAFEFLHDAAFESNSMPGPGTTADFFAGDAAFTVTQISRASELPEDGFNWELLSLPHGPEGEYSVTGQAGLGVLTASKNEDAAAEFLAFFTNPENAEELAEFFPPPRESLLTAEVLSESNPRLSPEQIESVVVPGIETGEVRPGHSNNQEISQKVRASLDDLWKNNADIEEILGATCASIETYLKDAES